MTPVYACSADGKTLYSLGAAAVTGDQVASVSFPVNASGGPNTGAEVLVTFNASGKVALATMTQDLATKTPPQSQMAIYAVGRVQTAPTVMEPITAGKFVIAGDFTQAQAGRLVNDINGT